MRVARSAIQRAHCSRGAEVLSVDGAAVVDGSADVLNAGLFPEAIDEAFVSRSDLLVVMPPPTPAACRTSA